MDERTRKILEQEKDPRVLRGLVEAILKENERLKTVIKDIETEKALKDQQSFKIEEQVKLLRRQLYGKKSEIREASDRPRDKSQEAALIFSQAAFPAPEPKNNQKNRSKGQNLAEQVIEHHPLEAELYAESLDRGITSPSASQWVNTGLYDECSKIQIIERSYIKEIHRKYKYKLKTEFNDTDKDIIITASGPSSLLPGMNYTTEFIASIVADKYISHMPLERQTREMESLGLKGIQNSTLSRMAALAASSLESMAEAILQDDVLTSPLASHVDETPWKIQNKHEKDGYMWVISNSCGSYYFFAPTRSAEVIKDKLRNYAGPVVTDGWKSYDAVLEDLKIPRAYCWAHSRREFLPLEDHDPTIKPILDLIDKIFEIERKAKSFEDLSYLRENESLPVVNQLKSLLQDEWPKSRPGSQKRKAIEYSLNRWEGLTLFLKNIKVPLSNNEAERTIRHSVVGRKNYYGSGSHSGAETAATLFTLIESCKKNEIDPRTFLLMSLQKVANGEELETPLAYAKRIRSSQHAE
ncbi:MAG: IS66 family transposase [Bdellovibrio sp.]